MQGSITQKRINLYDLVTTLTNASDLVNISLSGHHKKVAYLSYKIARELGYSKSMLKDILMAGLLHDIGALSSDERLELIEREPPNVNSHAFIGAAMFEEFEPLREIAKIIRYHHIPWNNGKYEDIFSKEKEKPLILSHIVHLADRIAVLIDNRSHILGQVKYILESIEQRRGTVFVPELVDLVLSIGKRESIWLDLTNDYLDKILKDAMAFDILELQIQDVIQLAKIFSKLIDFRSPFTANHTAGVAKCAQALAGLAGFSKLECEMMLVAGYLHDLGKLAVSNDVLNKPGKVDPDEFNVIRSHTYYTYHLLKPIEQFDLINEWASFHHEKLNGKGYPFKLSGENISMGSRVMAVADIFTAVKEDRPYRSGMDDEHVKQVFMNMVDDGSICPYVAGILFNNYEDVDNIRIEAQREASLEYGYFIERKRS